jgi:hypothetical protein
LFNTIELLAMLLTNVTISDEGQKHVIGDIKKRGLILDNLFGMFCYFLKSGSFDFMANVFANVTAIKEGRDVVIEQSWLPKIIDMLRWNKVSLHRRKHLIECVRNVAFGYEAYEAKFKELNLIRELAFILASEEGLVEGLPAEVAVFKASKKPLEVSKVNVKNIVDTFILLSNSENLMKEIADLNLDLLLDRLDVNGKSDLETQAAVLIS